MKTECPNCKTEVKKDWNFCPHCGVMVNTYKRGEVTAVDDLATLNIMETPKQGGISIYVNSHNSENPEVRVSAFGDFKKYESELKRRMGVLDSKNAKRDPEIIKEPESILKRDKRKITVKVRVPELKEENIKVRKYENSIEIKGYAGNKLYYSSFEVPNNSEIVNRSLNEGIFTLILKV